MFKEPSKHRDKKDCKRNERQGNKWAKQQGGSIHYNWIWQLTTRLNPMRSRNCKDKKWMGASELILKEVGVRKV